MLTDDEQSRLANHVLATRGLKATATNRLAAFRQGVEAAIQVISDHVSIDKPMEPPANGGESC